MATRYQFDLTYSIHDGGWYAEVWDGAGATVWESTVQPTRDKAERAAREWIASSAGLAAEGNNS